MEQAFLASLLTSKYPSIINIYYTYSIALYVLVIQVLFRYFLNVVSVPAFTTFLGCAFLLSNSAWFYFPQIPLKPLYSSPGSTTAQQIKLLPRSTKDPD